MMRVGEQMEESLGRGGSVVRWFEADASKLEELARLPLRFKTQGYDLVMANCIKSDPEFWRVFLELLTMAVVKATKKLA